VVRVSRIVGALLALLLLGDGARTYALASADGASPRVAPVGAFAARSFPLPDRPVAAIISPEYSDEATRDRLGEAERVMNHLGITAGVRVADIGAGNGYYTLRLVRRLGPEATIYAQDVSAEYLRGL
jgi:predicted methyltransferase